MYQQEENGYKVSDYMKEIPYHFCNTNSRQSPDPIDIECRTVMADWCITIIKKWKYNPETTEIAWSYIDRFLSTADGSDFLLDRHQFQLLVLTSVYTAAKVHEAEALTPKIISKVSGGEFYEKDIERMEFRLLKALNWRVNPLTASSYVRLLVDIIPSDQLDKASRETITDLAGYQIELAICDYQLSLEKSSLVAFGAVQNALASIETTIKDGGRCSEIMERLAYVMLKRSDWYRLEHVQNCLYQAFTLQSTPTPRLYEPESHIPETPKEFSPTSPKTNLNISPKIVSAINQLCDTLSYFGDWLE